METVISILPSLLSFGSSLLGAFSSGSGSSSSASSSQTSTSQTSYSSTNYGESGANSNALAELMSAFGSTPTGNNANTAAQFNAQSAATANDLQTAQWNQSQAFNMFSNIASNALSLINQSSARSYNSKESQITRDWQQMMRQTAYQDTVSDLKAAGLNPILAAQNGATGNYTGAEASTSALQGIQQTSASVPTAHTANMSAMYDYGNNTTQFLNNALAVVNSAKTQGYNNVVSGLESMMSNIMESSGTTVSELAKQTGIPSGYYDKNAYELIKEYSKGQTGSKTTGGMNWAD